MSDDDSLSKTMIIPNPGGRRTSTQANEPAPFDGSRHTPVKPTMSPQQHNHSNIGLPKGENVILFLSHEILVLAGNIRSLEPSKTVQLLRKDVEQLIERYTNALTEHSVSKEVILTSRYIICCLLDELVLSTPWGSDSEWSHQTLLVKYHNETWGGEKFFLIVNKLLEQPQRSIDLIELCYLCIAIGFSGKYRVSQQGNSELINIGETIYNQISQYRPVDRDLSPKWQGVSSKQKNSVSNIPLFVFIFSFLFILAGTYIGFLLNLQSKVDPVYENLESIGWKDFVIKIKEQPQNSVQISQQLRDMLSVEIADKMLDVIVNSEEMLTIRFSSTSLFKSGNTAVNENALPDVNILVNAIKKYSDSVLVIGHTDSTGKADSNWVISRRRAEAIAEWLKKANYQLDSIITRGVADTQPVINNDNSYNRSLNRRVDIILVMKG